MSNLSLDDLVKMKKSGEKWYAIEAPEEIRFWHEDCGWPGDFFERHNVLISSIRVRGAHVANTQTLRISKKRPLTLPSGFVIDEGQVTTGAGTSVRALCRVDSTKEANLVLGELSNQYEISQWEIYQMRIFSKNAQIHYEKHNPDGNGTSLYLYRVVEDNDSRLYPQILYSHQEYLVGKFRGKIAHCSAVLTSALERSCAIKTYGPKRDPHVRRIVRE